jgi:hypothetical protein
MSYWNGREWADKAPGTADVKRDDRARHVVRTMLEVGLVTAVTFGLIVGSTFAAKGGSQITSTGSSLTLAMVDPSDTVANQGDQVTFAVSTTATSQPWVKLNCYQDGAWVSTATAGFFEAYAWAPNFTLASTAWSSGAGDCTATLYKVTSNGRTRNLATLSFHVQA